MTHRDRPSHEGGSPAFPLAADLTAPVGSLWEAWYPNATAAQRQQALALVRQQGLVHAHQLPPAAPPARTTPAVRLLQGTDEPLPRFEPEPFAPLDDALDEWQRLAVARGLSCPDLSLVQGGPGTGKSRLVAELLRQCVRQGVRTLFVSASPQGVDATLDRLDETDRAATVRLPGDEPVACSARPLLLPARVETFHRDALAAARNTLAAAEQRLAQRPTDDALLARAAELEQRHAALIREAAEADARITSLPATLEQESAEGTSPFAQACAAARQEHSAQADPLSARAKQLREQIDRALTERQAREAERSALTARAQSSGLVAWLSSLFAGDPGKKLDELQRREDRAREELARLELELARADDEQQQFAHDLAGRLAALREQETQARNAALTAAAVALRDQAARVQDEWAALVPDAPPIGPAALDSLRPLAEQAAQRAEAEVAARRRWLHALEQQAPADLADLVLAGARIVAATPMAAARAGGCFDLLVVDEAHRIGDADLIVLANRASRCVLVGEPDLSVPMPPPPRGVVRSAPPPGAFRRLWERLHADPRRWPTRWHRSGGSLVASLRPIAEEDSGWAHCEPVYDRPEIELRIVAPPVGEPQLAEVIFPGHTPLPEAREFIHRELQELAVETASANPRWTQRGEAIVLDLHTAGPGDTVCLTLETGVREKLARCAQSEGCVGWLTAGLEFDPRAGWDRERAERWAADRLGLRDTGRATCLTRTHRHTDDIARAIRGLLYSGRVPEADDVPGLQFVAVPNEPRREPEPRWSTGATVTVPRQRTARGAGLEIDLADPRRLPGPPQLPLEVRATLPPEGVVNVAEAMTLIDHLAALLSGPEAAQLEQVRGLKVAVIAPLPAQAALLKGLIARTEFYPRWVGRVEAGTPETFRQRECAVALVSLTRSHGTRAVPLSRCPDDLVLALTRASGRVVVFGDPGSLVRRGQWFGGLDHQDETVGPREQALARQLAACWPEARALTTGDHTARPPRSRESSSV